MTENKLLKWSHLFSCILLGVFFSLLLGCQTGSSSRETGAPGTGRLSLNLSYQAVQGALNSSLKSSISLSDYPISEIKVTVTDSLGKEHLYRFPYTSGGKGTINEVAVGLAKVTVAALDKDGQGLFSGSIHVEVFENQTTMVDSLTLFDSESQTSSLQIFNPAAIQVTETSAKISFLTNKEALGGVKYGLTESLEMESPLEGVAVTNHNVPLTNLKPGSLYFFRPSAHTDGGESVVGEINSFQTLSLATSTASPVATSSAVVTPLTVTLVSDYSSAAPGGALHLTVTTSGGSTTHNIDLSTTGGTLSVTNGKGPTLASVLTVPGTVGAYTVTATVNDGVSIQTATLNFSVTDDSAPTLSGFSVLAPAKPFRARVIWHSSETLASGVIYIATSSLNWPGPVTYADFVASSPAVFTFSPGAGTIHWKDVYYLASNTTYWYLVRAQDSTGNIGSNSLNIGSFTTAGSSGFVWGSPFNVASVTAMAPTIATQQYVIGTGTASIYWNVTFPDTITSYTVSIASGTTYNPAEQIWTISDTRTIDYGLIGVGYTTPYWTYPGSYSIKVTYQQFGQTGSAYYNGFAF